MRLKLRVGDVIRLSCWRSYEIFMVATLMSFKTRYKVSIMNKLWKEYLNGKNTRNIRLPYFLTLCCGSDSYSGRKLSDEYYYIIFLSMCNNYYKKVPIWIFHQLYSSHRTDKLCLFWGYVMSTIIYLTSTLKYPKNWWTYHRFLIKFMFQSQTVAIIIMLVYLIFLKYLLHYWKHESN